MRIVMQVNNCGLTPRGSDLDLGLFQRWRKAMETHGWPFVFGFHASVSMTQLAGLHGLISPQERLAVLDPHLWSPEDLRESAAKMSVIDPCRILINRLGPFQFDRADAWSEATGGGVYFAPPVERREKPLKLGKTVVVSGFLPFTNTVRHVASEILKADPNDDRLIVAAVDVSNRFNDVDVQSLKSLGGLVRPYLFDPLKLLEEE